MSSCLGDLLITKKTGNLNIHHEEEYSSAVAWKKVLFGTPSDRMADFCLRDWQQWRTVLWSALGMTCDACNSRALKDEDEVSVKYRVDDWNNPKDERSCQYLLRNLRVSQECSTSGESISSMLSAEIADTREIVPGIESDDILCIDQNVDMVSDISKSDRQDYVLESIDKDSECKQSKRCHHKFKKKYTSMELHLSLDDDIDNVSLYRKSYCSWRLEHLNRLS